MTRAATSLTKPDVALDGRSRQVGRSGQWLLVAVLTAAALVPRLANLGHLGFYSDEETTAMPSRALAAGEGAVMPSGMEYRRAFPLTWANAVSARILGLDDEAAYRLPAALLGAATVPLLLLLGRHLVGFPAAAIAAGLLLVSEWHLAFSRQARMYAPFMLLFFVAVYGVWQWAATGRLRQLSIGLLAYVAAVAFHTIGLLAALLFPLPLAWGAATRSRAWGLLAISPVALISGVLVSRWVSVPYERLPRPPIEAGAVERSDLINAPALDIAWPAATLLVAVGLVGGLWAARRTYPTASSSASGSTRLAVVALAVLAGPLAALGQLHAASLCALALLLVHPEPRGALLARSRGPLVALALLCAVPLTTAALDVGTSQALREAVSVPFPYLLYLARQSFGLILLFAIGAIWLAFHRPRADDEGARAATLSTVLILAAFGLASTRAPTRYLFPVYPFVLLAASFFLWRACVAAAGRLVSRERMGTLFAALAAVVVVASGILGGHGVQHALRTVTLEYGEPLNETVHTFPFRPDHKHPGEFVRREYRAGDIVVAEDPLQQAWYAGRVDYWYRRFGDMRRYLRVREDGVVIDAYVASRPASHPALIDSLAQHAEGRVWLVTSGETAWQRSYYLSRAQQDWLDSLRASLEPAFRGRDGVTEVYCLNCTRSPTE